MRLVIYSHSFTLVFGSIPRLVSALAQGVQGKSGPCGQVEVTVVAPSPAGEMDDRSFAFRVVRQPSLLKLFRLLREADLIHLAGPAFVPLGFCALLRKPVVIEHHGFQAVCPNGQLFYEPKQTLCPGHFMAGRHRECLRCNSGQGRLRSLRMWALTFPRRWLCRHVAAHVTPTQWLASELRLARTTSIHHGIEPSQEGPVSRSRSQAPTLAFIGRLVSTKGVAVLLEAAARLRRQGYAFELKIIGEGPDRARLEALSCGHGSEDCATFLGAIPAGAAEEVLESAWTVVVPSLAGEVFGLAVAEQMMRGRMVIASDLGPLSEVLGDAGLKFKPGDVEGLCACLRRVLEHPEIVEEYGAKARQRALKLFRSERMVEDHWELYRKLTRSRCPAVGRSADAQ